MKTLTSDGRTYHLPTTLNDFQQTLYLHLIDWKWAHITTEPGSDRGTYYDAILPERYAAQIPMLYPPVKDALREHRQKYPFRIHKYFNHMASSQAAALNLFLPVLLHPQANVVLAAIRPDFARLATEQLDRGFQVEFCAGPEEREPNPPAPFPKRKGEEETNLGTPVFFRRHPFLLGKGPGVRSSYLRDKTPVSGTDADIAIAYYNHQDDLCLWLIEHKLTESEFTPCGGVRSPGRKAKHRCDRSFADILAEPSLCYYADVKKFAYWEITERNRDFFPNAAGFSGCPFQGGLNQLWRNQLLALSIEQDARQPYRHVSFSVVRHPRNTALDASLEAYRRLTAGNPMFSTFTSADVLVAAARCQNSGLDAWIAWYRDLYDV